ncbi:MAG: hypothetical protein ACR5LD_10065 [Symbiopectobacterium sp.]
MREIEFITHVFQLIRGGHVNQDCKAGNCCRRCNMPVVWELLLPQQVNKLSNAYLFYGGWKTCCKRLPMSKRKPCRKKR